MATWYICQSADGLLAVVGGDTEYPVGKGRSDRRASRARS